MKKPKQKLVRDYSNRSCQTCNLFNTNNGGEKACEIIATLVFGCMFGFSVYGILVNVI